MLLLLLACAGTPVDTAAPVDTDEPAETADSAPVDSADSAGDSGVPADTADTAATDVLTYYVSPAGDDAAAGTRSAPWRTLAGAQAALRALRTAGALDRPVEVELAAGTWTLDAPWTFGPDDSGTVDAPVTWRAPVGETVTLSGGVPVTGWTADGDDVVASVDEAPYLQLWVDGDRRPLARAPDTGFYSTAGTPGSLYDQLVYNADEVPAAWDLSHAEVQVYHDQYGAWETSRLWVAANDRASHTLTFTGASVWGQYAAERWYLENVPEALDAPGEWIHTDGLLRVRPHESEDLSTETVIVPRLEHLLLVTGDPSTGAYVQQVTFQGLTFAYTGWAPGAAGYAGIQAAVTEGAAIEVVGGRDLTFDGCVIEHTGAHGIWLREGTRDTTIVHTELADLGAGAVRLGTTSAADDSGGNTVENSFLHGGGRVLPSGQGVWIGQSSDNTVLHDHIADFYYTGVQVGWYWGYAATTASDNYVGYNVIEQIGQDMLSDMGGVYTLGVSPGTQVEHNVIRDVNAYGYGGWGLYTDEGSSFVTMNDNLVYSVDAEAFHQHYGEANVISNNILAYGQEAMIRRSRAEDHVSFYFLDNIVYSGGADMLYDGGYSDWTPGDYVMDHNLYADPVACSLDWAGWSWAEWQALGNDVDSLVADPLFADPANHDFTLDPSSPAFSLGFQAFDPTEAGLVGEDAWTSLPATYGWATPAWTDPPDAIVDDFEASAVGDPPAGASVWGATDTAWARVTDTEARSGAHSLELQDQPGLAAEYAPFFEYHPSLCGDVTATFAVKLEADALFYHEWRYWPSGSGSYTAGPSLEIDGAGNVYASWGLIGTVPRGEWLDVEMTSSVGDGASGAWNLAITSTSGGRQAWDALPGTPLPTVDWVGFVANANATARIWLDDLDVR